MAKKISRRDKTRGFLSGFKDFITRGNIIDLAVGVIIGGAFGKIVTSLVNDIITPPISLLFKGEELKDAKWILRPEILNGTIITQTEVALRYGNMIMLIIEFLIIAFSIYAALTLIIRRRDFIEKLEAEKLAETKANEVKETVKKEAVISEDVKLLREIRDLLKEDKSL